MSIYSNLNIQSHVRVFLKGQFFSIVLCTRQEVDEMPQIELYLWYHYILLLSIMIKWLVYYNRNVITWWEVHLMSVINTTTWYVSLYGPEVCHSTSLWSRPSVSSVSMRATLLGVIYSVWVVIVIYIHLYIECCLFQFKIFNSLYGIFSRTVRASNWMRKDTHSNMVLTRVGFQFRFELVNI